MRFGAAGIPVWQCKRFPGRQICVRRAVVPVDTGTATAVSGVAEAAAGACCGRLARWDSPAPVKCRCRSPGAILTTLRELPDVSPLVHSRCLVREKSDFAAFDGFV